MIVFHGVMNMHTNQESFNWHVSACNDVEYSRIQYIHTETSTYLANPIPVWESSNVMVQHGGGNSTVPDR